MADWSNVTAAILAGGFGTRLRSVVADRPKVLAQVAGKSFLSHLFDQLVDAGLREVVLLTGYGAEKVLAEYGDSHAGLRVMYSVETEPLGTGGAVRHALPQITGTHLLLLNGDSYCDLDLAAFRDAHIEREADASLALAWVEDASRFGRVTLDTQGRVTRFAEKETNPTAGLINAGVYLIDRTRIGGIPAGRALSLERDLLPRWVSSGSVFGFPVGTRFIDIGVPESFASAQTFFDGGRVTGCT